MTTSTASSTNKILNKIKDTTIQTWMALIIAGLALTIFYQATKIQDLALQILIYLFAGFMLLIADNLIISSRLKRIQKKLDKIDS